MCHWIPISESYKNFINFGNYIQLDAKYYAIIYGNGDTVHHLDFNSCIDSHGNNQLHGSRTYLLLKHIAPCGRLFYPPLTPHIAGMVFVAP